MNQRELFLRHVAQTSDEPMLGVDINIVKAEGSSLTDVNGKTYIDFISGISVSSIGHCHPKVVKAIQEQSERFMHLMVYGEYNQKPQVEYATLLCSQLPEQLNSVYFTTGGSEAVEAAVKLAKRVTGRSEIISFQNAYHGSTQGALSLMGDEYFKNSFRPLIPGGRLLRFNIMQDLELISEQTAAVVIEPIQGEAGVKKGDSFFLQKLRERCTETNTLLVFDEIQSGFGRSGRLFAFQLFDVIPDVLLIAKGMGGGLPIGAMVASTELTRQFTIYPVLGHINTFGGNAVCVAAAKASLDVILQEQLPEKALWIENTVREKLKHPFIKDLRMVGALGALEFASEAINKAVIKACIENGVISDWFLFCPCAMRIAPPLNISEKDLNKALEIVLKQIERVSKTK
ncbi:MAG: aspartate aminotransferase family protein [Bacteroidia bacterium]|nr:aspartate aminotransferase family protein [Bacteroidia bacterium]